MIIPKLGMEYKYMADALFSKVRQKVLGLIYSNPDADFNTNEVIRACHSGAGAVQRELERLFAAGYVIVKQVGNQKRYQANKSAPSYEEMRGIILKSFGLADVIRESLKSILLKRVLYSFIFGSIAKQTDTAKSNIDLLFIGNDLTYADIFKLLHKTEKQLGRTINPIFYTPSEWKNKVKENNNFINQILKQPKIFLKGNETELKEFGKSH